MQFVSNLDLLEGLKRAQRFRLEDQRGTEINFELPDFLKDNNKKNINSSTPDSLNARDAANDVETCKKSPGKAPQPAPRFSINRSQSHNNPIESSSFSEASNDNGDRSLGMICFDLKMHTMV